MFVLQNEFNWTLRFDICIAILKLMQASQFQHFTIKKLKLRTSSRGVKPNFAKMYHPFQFITSPSISDFLWNNHSTHFIVDPPILRK